MHVRQKNNIDGFLSNLYFRMEKLSVLSCSKSADVGNGLRFDAFCLGRYRKKNNGGSTCLR